MEPILGLLRGFTGGNTLAWVARILVLFFSICCHEYAHARVAYALGDDTAKQLGRMTINPIRHVEPFGLIMMLFAPVGWMKPVPVNPNRFKKKVAPRWGILFVAIAGPAMNILLAFLGLFISSAPFMSSFLNGLPEGMAAMLVLLLQGMVIFNLSLAAFNMLPIPPLDGFNIWGTFLPPRVRDLIYRYSQYCMIFLIVLVWSGNGVFSRVLHTSMQITQNLLLIPIRAFWSIFGA